MTKRKMATVKALMRRMDGILVGCRRKEVVLTSFNRNLSAIAS